MSRARATVADDTGRMFRYGSPSPDSPPSNIGAWAHAARRHAITIAIARDDRKTIRRLPTTHRPTDERVANGDPK